MDKQIENFFKKNSEANDEIIENDEDINKEIEEMEKMNLFDEKMNIIKEREEEYVKAYNYFEKNIFHKQQEDAKNCIDIISKIKKEMEKGKKNGKWKVVDLSLLPKEIKPEYIYGCKYEERNEKFCEVITLIENRLKEVRKN